VDRLPRRYHQVGKAREGVTTISGNNKFRFVTRISPLYRTSHDGDPHGGGRPSPVSMDALAASCCSSALANGSSVMSQLSRPRGRPPGLRLGVWPGSPSRLPALASIQSRPGRAAAWSGWPQEEHCRWSGELPEIHRAWQAAQAAGETRDRGSGPACTSGWPGRPAGMDGGRVPPGLAVRAGDGGFRHFPDPGRRHRFSSNSPAGGPFCAGRRPARGLQRSRAGHGWR
jgi:hypothetical protein